MSLKAPDGNWYTSDLFHPPLRSVLGKAYYDKCKEQSSAYGKCVDGAHLNSGRIVAKNVCKETFEALMECVKRNCMRPAKQIEK